LIAIRTSLQASRWIVLAALALPLAAQAVNVTGTVTNKTTGRPDAGDTVALLSLANGMQEVASTKTDAQGHYTLPVADSDMHLVRVEHEKATYYAPVPPGTTHVDVSVYDVAAKLKGVKTEDDVYQMQTDAQGLHVIESFFVDNNSTPPRTQFSAKAYEFTMPAGAQIDGGQAAGPQGMPISSTPVPTGEKGHYAFVFPLRPGQTRFAVSYSLPYSGKLTFAPQESLPTDNVAVMLPNSMTFTPGAAGLFQPVHDQSVPAQTFVAKSIAPGQKIAFTVSGTGAMPRSMQDQSGGQSSSAAQAAQGGQGMPDTATSQGDRPGGGLGVPIDTPGPLHKYRWWILSAIGLLLVIAAAFMLRGQPPAEGAVPVEPEPSPLTPTVMTAEDTARDARPQAPASRAAAAPVAAPSAGATGLLPALKEELFALETERVEGRLTEAQYAEAKAALEVVLRRALGRRS
jgi:5-hydroxyisourate hydrolase-like protein (transthyretin family)